MLKKIFLTLLAVFLFTGAVQAQDNGLPEPGMLPGNPFYFLKTWGESIGTFFTFNDEAKAERMLYLSEKRLAEVNELSILGEADLAEETIVRYEKQLTAALERAQEAKLKGQDVDDVLFRVAEATYKHQDVLTDVYERVPEQARESIQRAMQESMRGHEEALKAIPLQERERVMENVQEKMQEVEQKMQELRERGISIPDVPKMQQGSLDTVIENLPKVEIQQRGR